ncbi:unnamed protein product [marine sediment metagenome]|uniref:Type II secretion system protein GspG C-terminal domain-containing protein n=1 Tax=marine sediment metagenome TaxID=412755 RepID=X0XQY7_9ZZZZ
MNCKQAFTLVEILIVVIILGILAAIVIPQFTEASDDARESALRSDLQTMRSQLELYKAQHTGSYPGALTFVTDMTTKSGEYGPYVQTFPTNPYNSLSDVTVEDGAALLGDGNTGWHFDSSTGRFSASDDATHAAW